MAKGSCVHLSNYHRRLETFKGWPLSGPVSAEKMSQAGFYYMGVEDSVKCYYCEKELDAWDPEDNPFKEHVDHSSVCPFVKMFKEPPTSMTLGQALQLEKEIILLKIERKREKFINNLNSAEAKWRRKLPKY